MSMDRKEARSDTQPGVRRILSIRQFRQRSVDASRSTQVLHLNSWAQGRARLIGAVGTPMRARDSCGFTIVVSVAPLLLLCAPPALAQQLSPCEAPSSVHSRNQHVLPWVFPPHVRTSTHLGDTGLFRLSAADVLPGRALRVSLFRDNQDRSPKDVDFSTHGLAFGYGLTCYLEVFGSIGVQNRLHVEAPSGFGTPNNLPLSTNQGTAGSRRWTSGFGDIRIGAKLQLMTEQDGHFVSLALIGHVKFPTASSTKLLGTGRSSESIAAAVQKMLSGQVAAHAIVGFDHNRSPASVSVSNAAIWGAGLSAPLRDWVYPQVEISGAIYTDGTVIRDKPVDFIVGPVFRIRDVAYIRPALSLNLNLRKPWPSGHRDIEAGFHLTVGFER
jgi:hypothetical protein